MARVSADGVLLAECGRAPMPKARVQYVQ